MEGNMDVHEKEGYVWVSVNPRVYPLAVVYSAAYAFIDDCYVLIDGDPVEEIIVELRPKEKKDLRTLGLEFNTELVNYANYTANYIKNAKIKETILKRVLLPHDMKAKGSAEQITDSWEKSFAKRLEELQKPENEKSNRGEEKNS